MESSARNAYVDKRQGQPAKLLFDTGMIQEYCDDVSCLLPSSTRKRGHGQTKTPEKKQQTIDWLWTLLVRYLAPTELKDIIAMTDIKINVLPIFFTHPNIILITLNTPKILLFIGLEIAFDWATNWYSFRFCVSIRCILAELGPNGTSILPTK